MYLKVYYHPDGIGPDHNATVELVRAYLPDDMPGLEVLDTLGYPTVELPEGARYADYQKLQKHLQDAGFETE